MYGCACRCKNWYSCSCWSYSLMPDRRYWRFSFFLRKNDYYFDFSVEQESCVEIIVCLVQFCTEVVQEQVKVAAINPIVLPRLHHSSRLHTQLTTTTKVKRKFNEYNRESCYYMTDESVDQTLDRYQCVIGKA